MTLCSWSTTNSISVSSSWVQLIILRRDSNLSYNIWIWVCTAGMRLVPTEVFKVSSVPMLVSCHCCDGTFKLPFSSHSDRWDRKICPNNIYENSSWEVYCPKSLSWEHILQAGTSLRASQACIWEGNQQLGTEMGPRWELGSSGKFKFMRQNGTNMRLKSGIWMGRNGIRWDFKDSVPCQTKGCRWDWDGANNKVLNTQLGIKNLHLGPDEKTAYPCCPAQRQSGGTWLPLVRPYTFS